jgi:hypothetical protein
MFVLIFVKIHIDPLTLVEWNSFHDTTCYGTCLKRVLSVNKVLQVKDLVEKMSS